MPPSLIRAVRNMNAFSSLERLQTLRTNIYEVRPAATGDGFDLISDSISCGRLRLSKQHVAVGYATLHSGARASVIRVYDEAGQLIATHEQSAGRGAVS